MDRFIRLAFARTRAEQVHPADDHIRVAPNDLLCAGADVDHAPMRAAGQQIDLILFPQDQALLVQEPVGHILSVLLLIQRAVAARTAFLSGHIGKQRHILIQNGHAVGQDQPLILLQGGVQPDCTDAVVMPVRDKGRIHRLRPHTERPRVLQIPIGLTHIEQQPTAVCLNIKTQPMLANKCR